MTTPADQPRSAANEESPNASRPPVPVPVPTAHLAARLSIIAGFACCALNCVGNRLLFQMPQHDRRWDYFLGAVSSGCLLAGVLLGAIGLVGGMRAKKPDSVLMAIIGLTLNCGILAVMIWILSVIWQPAAS